MKLLRARLCDLERKKREAKDTLRWEEQPDIAWGSQIRSYIFHPYSLVKDHRTGVEIGNITAVMDGEIDPFIIAYLKGSVKNNEKISLKKTAFS
jgi:peptide chain release factor 2